MIICNEWKTEKRHECTNMGKLKRLELWWQLYVTSLPEWDVRNIRPLDFCWTECTYQRTTELQHDKKLKPTWIKFRTSFGGGVVHWLKLPVLMSLNLSIFKTCVAESYSISFMKWTEVGHETELRWSMSWKQLYLGTQHSSLILKVFIINFKRTI